MMYIRTKNGVYEVEQSQLEDDEEVVNCEYGQIGKLEIKSKSENLEELCDGFYIDFKNVKCFDIDKIGEPYTYEEFKDSFMSYREYEGKGYSHCDGYGFIKTDKGLIYVAKMDSEGKLVLI